MDLRVFALWVSVPIIGAFIAAGAQPAAAVGTDLSSVRATVVSALPTDSPNAGSAEYDATNITSVGGFASTSEISIAMGGGTSGRPFSLDVRPATGSTFAQGTYVSGNPGDGALEALGYGNASCESVRFRILDLVASGTTVTRLDLDFWTNCGYDSDDYADIYGELSIGEPQPSTTLITGTRDIGWPDTPVGSQASADVPVWIRNSGAGSQPVSAPTVSGDDPADFAVAADSCPTRLGAGASCSIEVAFTPRGTGQRSAAVTVAAGSAHVVTDVSGVGPAGQTFLRTDSQPGDYVGDGRSDLITDAQSPMVVQPTSSSVFAAAIAGDADWQVRIGAGNGPLAIGTHNVDASDNDGYQLVVTGYGRGCSAENGSVTISQVSYADGQPAAFDASFTQRCTDTPGAALTGEIAYRATTGTGTGTTTPTAAATATRVTTQPRSVTVVRGRRAVLESGATGTPTPTVQWQVGSGRVWTNMRGATGPVLTMTPTTTRTYRAVFTNALATAPSRPATVTVQTKPVVTRQPRSRTARLGHTLDLYAVGVGSPAPTEAWQVSRDGGRRWTTIRKSDRTSLRVHLTRHDARDRYRARFSNPAGTTYSRVVHVAVRHRNP